LVEELKQQSWTFACGDRVLKNGVKTQHSKYVSFFIKMIPILKQNVCKWCSSRVKYSLSIRKGELSDDDYYSTSDKNEVKILGWKEINNLINKFCNYPFN
jgi:hypothetical protein